MNNVNNIEQLYVPCTPSHHDLAAGLDFARLDVGPKVFETGSILWFFFTTFPFFGFLLLLSLFQVLVV